jgi:hypothetical protein
MRSARLLGGPDVFAYACLLAAGAGETPAFASACGPEGRQQVGADGLSYQRVAATIAAVDPADSRYAWQDVWGRIRLDRGSLVSSADPALYQIVRFSPLYSTALTRSGYYLQFDPPLYGDRPIADIRLAAAPELINRRPIGSLLMQPRPGDGPVIAGYRFQMAEPLMGSSDFLGIWRRTGTAGAQSLLVLFSRQPDRPDGYATRLVGRSDLAFSTISQTDSMHGGIWSFTLFTEASCPAGVAMLSYRWVLSVPEVVRP